MIDVTRAVVESMQEADVNQNEMSIAQTLLILRRWRWHLKAPDAALDAAISTLQATQEALVYAKKRESLHE